MAPARVFDRTLRPVNDETPDDDTELHVELRDDGELVCVVVAGSLDLRGSAELLRALDAVEPGRSLVLELSGVDFMDSTGVTSLIRAVRRHGARLTAPSPRVLRTLELAGATELLDRDP